MNTNTDRVQYEYYFLIENHKTGEQSIEHREGNSHTLFLELHEKIILKNSFVLNYYTF